MMASGSSKRKLKDTSPVVTGRLMMKNLMRTPTNSQQREQPIPDNGEEGVINEHSTRHVRDLQPGRDHSARSVESQRVEGERRSETGKEGDDALSNITVGGGNEDEKEEAEPERGAENDMMAFLKQFKRDMLRSNKKVEDRIAESEVRIKGVLETRVEELKEEIQDLRQRNGELEKRMERLEKDSKRKNVLITGIEASAGEISGIINAAIRKSGKNEQIKLDVTGSFETKKGDRIVRAECRTQEDKRVLMRSKKDMVHKGRNFFVNDDLTREEQGIQYKARCFARDYQGKGKATVGYRKVYVDGKELVWNEEQGNFIERA